MKQHSFTPGPWEVFDANGIVGVTTTAANSDVAHLTHIDGSLFHSHMTREEVLTTARLIAQAPALYALARAAADSGTTLQARAAQILRAISGAPDAGFTGQEQAKETGATHTWRGPAANFQNLPKPPQLPPDVAAALGAAFIGMREQGLSGSTACRMVREVLGRYCNAID